MQKTLTIVLFIYFSILNITSGQTINLPINPLLLTQEWQASWITHPSSSLQDYGVFHFRNTFNLSSHPSSFVIHVSADNRYRLFVNGEPVGFGPARGDLGNWCFETYDISSKLKPGKNVIASVVWNMGGHAPLAQQTFQTAFIVQGDTEKESMVNTNTKSWKVLKNESYFPIEVDFKTVQGYYAAGACDSLIGSKYPWDWEKKNYLDKSWLSVRELSKGEPAKRNSGYGNYFGLVPRSIPMMEESKQRFNKVARSSGNLNAADFITGKNPLTIPKKSKIRILLDQGQLTVGYPELLVSGGKDSKIRITYSEALFDSKNQKGNRDSIEKKEIKGYHDVFVPDGKDNRVFRPLWMRTFRYVQLDIEVGSQPLQIKDFYSVFTAYPFEQRASFSSNDPTLKRIWDVSWHTARLCAGETYFDCPYYEQLQYIGDTKIQSMISLYVSGDDRLMRNAINQFNQSRIPQGVTMSRYPTGFGQVIPPFSLIWVTMAHDYFMYRDDTTFVKGLLPGVQSVLGWFNSKIDKEKGILGKLDWWNFMDWAKEFNRGVPDGAEDGNSALISLQYAYALDLATELFYNLKEKQLAKEYADLSYSIKTSVYKTCFDDQRQLIADTPLKTKFSQHTNLMAILTDTYPAKKQKEVMQKLINDTSLTQTTIYFRYYFNRTLKKVGLGNLYVECLDPWKNMLNDGLTTFAETDQDPRSDCHAWSASPNFDLLSIVCGIESAAPGFKKVEISPYLGILQEINGSMPHPLGEISVSFQRKGQDGISGEINLPEGLTGRFIWKGKTLPLKGGSQKVEL